MSHISTLRFLCHSSFLCANPIFERSLLFSSLLPKQRALFSCQSGTLPVFGCAGRRGRRQPGGGGNGGFQRRKGSSTLREKSKETAPLLVPEMEEKEAVAGYNKKRAEGRDKRDRTRTLQLKTRKLNPVSTTCYVQILGTGMDTQDTSPSVFLFFDKQRFIFNAGEGLQRFCTEHKIKLSKVDHLFFTRVSSETAGGLPGLLLTLAGIGEEGISVNIWGPSDLDFLVNAMKLFIPNAAMVHTHSFGETQNSNGGLGSSMHPIVLIDDEVVRLSAISLKPNSSAGTMKPGDIAVVYICELPEIKGKFDPEKAAACGLKPGPKYRELQLGNSVMSDSLNITVHPCDVLGPSVPGPIVILVDCPTESHMAELFDAKSLNCYYVDLPDCQREHSKLVNCMIHLGPATVTRNVDYQNWMKRFGRTQHIMAGHEMKNMAIPILKSSARIAAKLNYLSPQLFPAPGFWSQNDSSSVVSCEIPTSNSVDIVAAENLLKFHLRPYSHLGLDKSSIPTSLDRDNVVNELLSEIPEMEDVCNSISQLWGIHSQNKEFEPTKNVKKDLTEEPLVESSHLPLNAVSDVPSCLNNVSREEMEIVLLGTGSAQPSKYRNVSSILINLFSKGSLLLDCGEGTLAQLKRRFGVEGADKAVRSLKCIWISHIHADHHTGLARILALRCQLLKDVPHEPLLVVGPWPLKRFLDAYSRLEDLDMLFLDCRHTVEPFLDTNGSLSGLEALDRKETNLFAQGGGMQSCWMKLGSLVETDASRAVLRRLKEVLCEAGLESLSSVPVVHCPQAFAVVLKAAGRRNCSGRVVPGWKVVYSGDTRPCQSLIDASRNATVLIHEATFEDGLREEAMSRNHSTTSEAIQVGSTTGAYRVILTHFSQRYPKIPVFDEIHMNNTCIAFDLMSVNLADLPLLPKVLPYLKVLFKNVANVDESEDVVAMTQY
ncbi:hypothetical protein HPP92_023543 [Vanilla planifolia]|uniref:ribonuclease Z n=1 Tax=Vanilla planifolia TaxID=51239 RepID=A0A835UC42_VANPL|nr:hypothetical protein HPP92_023543 [Vanilla planifolia]